MSDEIDALKQEARRRIHGLVEDYMQVLASGKKETFNEERVKIAFVLPMLEALGWNPRTDEILPEQATLTGRADFGLRAGGRTKIFVEMKNFRVSLDGHHIVKGSPRSFTEQAIQYAWSMKADWATLTNFEETRLYDSHVKKPEDGLVWRKPIRFNEYESRFEELWLISRHSVISGALDAHKAKIQRPPVDKAFLDDLMNCRQFLAEDIRKYNPRLTYDQISESVQKILDRLIFIKNCEDRLIIPAESLWKRYKAWQETAIDKEIVVFMMDLKNMFRYFDQVYNGKLFEKHPCEDLRISNEVFEEIINILYGDGQHLGYNFSVIPTDVLGQAYELYIGSIIKEKEGQTKALEIVKTPAKRKASGIFYTPEPIVDYIVRNTVGKVLKECKTPEEVSKIKVLDPACGSGSFLIKTFDVIKEWYDEYNKKNQQVNAKGLLDSLILPIPNPEERILINNLFGVDLDPQAVEITILNLSLKAVKTKEKLPYMADHIKCGNSLIDDIEVAGKRAFIWEKEFPQIMKNGGFDVIIGNPPYVRSILLRDDTQTWKYYRTHYKTAFKEFDIYLCFLEKAYYLLAPNGRLGFIMPNKWLHAEMGEAARKFFKENRAIETLVNFGSFQVFDEVTTYTMLIFLRKIQNAEILILNYVGPVETRKIALNFNDLTYWQTGSVKYETLSGAPWNLVTGEAQQILEKLKHLPNFGEYFSLAQGTGTRADQVFFVRKISEIDKYFRIFSKQTQKEYDIEKVFVKPSVKGKDIDSYEIKDNNQLLIFPYRDSILIDKKEIQKLSPNLMEYLEECREPLEKRENERWKGSNFYCFGRPQNHELLPLKKILVPVIVNRAKAAWDAAGLHVIDSVYFVRRKKQSNIDDEYILALLNSNLLTYFLMKTSSNLRGGYFSMKPGYVDRFPLKVTFSTKQEKEIYTQIIETVKRINTISKSDKEIVLLKEKIDELIFKLYELDKEDQKEIESLVKGLF